ncbi:nucleoside triphosphate pyrophosphatase [uncultured Actinomyces sp.]|uniref:Maf family protein n=1 Tax=uncultured Actinomyces sp. TaxID=249061 RepID=UPI0028D247F4|nr:nucleoside triphosphate pyrophosphatase [uncultured Actinomyces sp.]
MHLVLASHSPARRRILQEAGITPIIKVSRVDEDSILDRIPSASPAEKVCALAAAKGRAVASAICAGQFSPHEAALPEDECVLVACDSMLEADGELLGKPHNPQVALARVKALSKAQTTLWSGHYLAHMRCDKDGWQVLREDTRPSSTDIHFGSINDEEARAYVASGEPLEVAGSFTIDGLGGAFIEAIEGDHHNVIGISLPLIRTMMADMGLQWVILWDRKGPDAH